MSPFKVRDLPQWIKTTHESQNHWRKKNWENTLNKHKDELESLLKKINTLNKWSNKLQGNKSSVQLIPEIFIDGYTSLHFACFGLYKYAHICLRSEIETALRLVFFFQHPIEYEWWCNGNRWFLETLHQTDVWGRGYVYFEQLNNIKKFNSLCDKDKQLLSEITKIHKELSKSIHSGAGYLQSRSDRISPEYSLEKYNIWIQTIFRVQTYINTLFILGFSEEFKEMGKSDRKEILQIGVGDVHYIDKLNEMDFNFG
jgi:hypothetical protein